MVAATDLPDDYTKSAAPFLLPPTNVDTCSLALTVGPDQFVSVDWGLLESRSTLTKREHPAHSQSLGHGLTLVLPGAAGAKTDRDYPAHRYCHYMGPHFESVSLIFGMSDREYRPDEGETAVKVAGKPTYQYDDHDSGCQLTTQNPAGGTSGNGFTETLKLIVITDGGSSVCKQATKLAEKLWAKLPAA